MTDHEIITRAEWAAGATHGRFTALVEPAGWFVHYVGADMNTCPTVAQSAASMRSLQAQAQAGIHGDTYIDFPYNFAVDPCGRIFEGRGFDAQGGATANNNSTSLSVVYLGGPNTPVTPEARDALRWLTQEGARRKPSLVFVQPHSAVYATACPGNELRAFVPELHAHLHDPVVPIDWKALAELAAWAKRVSAKPLRFGDRGPDVVSLKKLLDAQGYTESDPRNDIYGTGLEKDVHKFKVDRKIKPSAGDRFGSTAVKALMKPKP